jgi:anti-repressor protein
MMDRYRAEKICGIRTVVDATSYLVSARDACQAVGYKSASGTAEKLATCQKLRVRVGKGSRELLVIDERDFKELAHRKGEMTVYKAWLAAVDGRELESLAGPSEAAETNTLGYSAPGFANTPPCPDSYTVTTTSNDAATVFQHSMFGEIRIVDNNGEPWFIANDVARALGYARPENAIREHCKGVTETGTPSPGGMQASKIISEKDLYRLIMHSKLPSAEAFQDWVMDEVLPSIRKHGAYMTPATIETMLEDPKAFRSMLDKLIDERQRRVSAETELAAVGGKILALEADAEFGQVISKTSADVLVEVVAKELTNAGWRINRDRLFAWLRHEGLLCKSRGKGWNLPTMSALDNGYFNLVERVIHKGTVDERVCTTTYVTGVGQRHIMDTIMARYPKGIVPAPEDAVKPAPAKVGLLSQLGQMFGSRLKQQELSL